MTHNLITLSEPLFSEANGERVPPTEFRIFPLGSFETSKGTFLFDRDAGESVLAAWQEHGNELSFDYEHAALRPPGEISRGAPAAAWFRLELRDDGLYAVDVKWTERAHQFLSAGEYRYFSPAFAADPDTGRVTRLVNIALTNLPATRDMTPLVAAKEDKMNVEEMLKSLMAKFEAIEARLDKLEGKDDDEEEKEDDEDAEAPEKPAKKSPPPPPPSKDPDVQAMSEVGLKIVKLTGRVGPEAEGVILGWRAASEQVISLTQRVQQLEREKSDREIHALLEGGLKSGKLVPAQRTWALSIGVEALKGYLASAPRLVHTSAMPAPMDGTVTLTEIDRDVMARLGCTEEQYIQSKQRHASQK